MDKNITNENIESTEEKVDLSEIHNKMFDQNPETFTEADFMNRDYLNHIYGEDMDFLNKEIRQSRIKYYQERQEIEEIAINKIKQEKKNLFICCVISLIGLAPLIAVFINFIKMSQLYVDAYEIDMLDAMSSRNLQTDFAIAGFAFGFGLIFFVIEVIIFAFIILGIVKKIKQIQYGKENALKRLADKKEEYMFEGLYDAE